MSVGDQDLHEALSEALRLRLEIEAGGNPAILKMKFYKRLEATIGKPFVDLMLAVESTFVGKTERLEQTVINISGGNFANLNLGEQIGTIKATVNVIASQGKAGADLATALRSLTEGIGADTGLTDAQKKEALEAVETIADQANLPAEQRRPGVFKAAIGHLPTILSATVASIKIWETVHPVLAAFFAG